MVLPPVFAVPLSDGSFYTASEVANDQNQQHVAGLLPILLPAKSLTINTCCRVADFLDLSINRAFPASLRSAIVQSRAFPGRILTTDGHGWTRMGQRLLIRAHPCLSVVEFLGLRLAALGLWVFASFALKSGNRSDPSHSSG
jgi:hypothetical protein